MGKITNAFNRSEKERNFKKNVVDVINQKNEMSDYGIIGKKGLKNSLLIWVFVGAVLITVLLAFNKQGSQKIPLSEIFPEQEVFPVDVEYEFVGSEVVDQIEPKEVVDMEKKQVAVTVEEKKVVKTPVAEVVVKALELQTPVGNYYAVQVSSFKNSSRAKRDVDNLIKKGYEAYSIPKNLGSKGTWHRVYIGKFITKNSAVVFLKEVKKEFKDSFIRKIK